MAKTRRLLGGLLLCLAPALASEPASKSLRALLAAHQEAFKPADPWPDLSMAALRAHEAQDRATLERLHKIPHADLAGDDRTLYDLFERDLNNRLEAFRLRLYLLPYWDDPRTGAPAVAAAGAVRAAVSGSAPDGYAQRLRKLEAAPVYVKQAIALLREGMAAGLLPPKEAVRQMSGIGGLGAISPRGSGGHGAPGLDEFYKFIREEYYPACPETYSLAKVPGGDAIYRLLVRRSTTTNLSPAEIHELGLREVARIRGEMTALAAKEGFKGSLDEFLAHVAADKRFYFTNKDDLLAAYRAAAEHIEKLLPKVVGRLPVRKLRVDAVEYGGAAAMYQAPRGGSDGVVVVDVSRLEIRPKFEIIPLMLHEGMPGHHLQLALQGELHPGGDAGLTACEMRLRRSAGFSEGWALYAETLGDEMGLYTGPYDKFGRLSMDLMRAVRLVVDTGIHLHGWSTERAKQYFMAATGKPEAMAALEVSRSNWPGVSVAYKVGEVRIRAMRDRAARALGARFDLRSFHDALLRWGPLPLDMLETRLDECLAEPACRAVLSPAA